LNHRAPVGSAVLAAGGAGRRAARRRIDAFAGEELRVDAAPIRLRRLVVDGVAVRRRRFAEAAQVVDQTGDVFQRQRAGA